jgi:hypothetical protein
MNIGWAIPIHRLYNDKAESVSEFITSLYSNLSLSKKALKAKIKAVCAFLGLTIFFILCPFLLQGLRDILIEFDTFKD